MKIIRTIAVVLFVLSLPIFLLTSYELFNWIVIGNAPHKLFFSTTELLPRWAAKIMLISLFSYYPFLFFAAIITLHSFFQPKKDLAKLAICARLAFLVYSIHFILAYSYESRLDL